jgi:hypothetical protein
LAVAANVPDSSACRSPHSKSEAMFFWVMNEHAYEGEAFSVIEVGSTAVRSRLTFRGGGC